MILIMLFSNLKLSENKCDFFPEGEKIFMRAGVFLKKE